ncbi:hypothetical protein ACWGH8_21200 [Nonomuraea muscovyensis]
MQPDQPDELDRGVGTVIEGAAAPVQQTLKEVGINWERQASPNAGPVDKL